jgi:hypothetical protein
MQDLRDCLNEALPSGYFCMQPLSARRGQPIGAGAPIPFGNLPSGGYQALQLQALEGWIKRARFHLDGGVRGLADGLGDAVTVQRPESKRAEDQHVERALEKFDARGFHRYIVPQCIDRLLYRRSIIETVSDVGRPILAAAGFQPAFRPGAKSWRAAKKPAESFATRGPDSGY